MTRYPSIQTLAQVFDDAKQARAILTMSHTELRMHPIAKARIDECLHFPGWIDVRLTVLNSIDPGLFGIECAHSSNGEHAEYLNTGDTYAPTLIVWRGNYRVQSLGDFVETMERQGVRFTC